MPACPAVPSPWGPAFPYLLQAGAEAGVVPGLRRPTGAVQAGAVADWAGICRWAERRATLSGTVIGAQ